MANGNSEQTISRDIYRLGQRFDFFRMLSCYFTTIGFYFSSLVTSMKLYLNNKDSLVQLWMSSLISSDVYTDFRDRDLYISLWSTLPRAQWVAEDTYS